VTRSVLIVGGAGSVGSRIGGILARRSDLHVIVGARSLDAAAQSVAASFGADIRVIDLNAPASWEAALRGVDLVIVCMDQQGPGFARKVLSSGIHYVDVTAGDSFFQSVEALPGEEVRATALLSVGLAPGITNLLAADAASALDSVERIDIGLLLGLGDTHGEAALRWTLRNMLSERAVESQLVDFGRGWGSRRAHWMNFADQHALRRTMPGVGTATRMAFESRLVTALGFAAGAVFGRGARLEGLLLRVASMFSFGSDACVAVAEATGLKGGKRAKAVARFQGRREADVTASVAAAASLLLLEKSECRGVFHIHQLFKADEIATCLAREGSRLQACWPPVAVFLGEELAWADYPRQAGSPTPLDVSQ
jgi:hypothetical protein